MAHNRRLSQFANAVGYDGGDIGINTLSNNDGAHFQHYQSEVRHQSFQSSNGDLAIVTDNNSNPAVYVKGTGTADLVNIFDNTTEVFTILDGGKVGIGTHNPQHPLHLHNAGSSNVVTTRIQQESSNTPTDGGALLELGGTRSNGTFGFYGGIKGGRRNNAADNKGYLAFFADNNDGQSLNEKARIDHGGRLMVQCTSDSTDSLLIVQGNAGDSDTGGQISIQRGGNANPTAPSDLGGLMFKDSAANRGAVIAATCDGDWASNDYPTRLEFKVTADNASSPTERMRINKKGFMKMGPRITDGSHGVADLNSARHEFTSDDNGWTIIVTHTSGAASEHEGILIDFNLDPNGTANSFIQGNAGDNTRFRVASNGGLYNYQSNDSNLSDEREKKNIVSLDSKWDKVKSWDLKKFHYNEDDDGDDLRYGVIAQQIEPHCPEVITDWVKQESKDAILDEDGNVVTPAQEAVVRKGVKEEQMMWMAIKALQEAQTRIETLEAQNADLLARVTALENP